MKNKNSLEILKAELKKKKPIIGANSALKLVKNSRAKQIYVSKNCPTNLKEDLKRYSEIFKAEYHELDINSEELGVLCKKTFPIAVLSYD